MKKYSVRVNGTEYHVEVEQVADGAAAPPPSQAAPAAAPAPAPAPTPAPAPVSGGGGGQQIKAPMPGTILSINIQQGQTVKSGQVLMVLEAMKMENEIMSPKSGTVTSIFIQSGASVENGTLLCTIL